MTEVILNAPLEVVEPIIVTNELVVQSTVNELVIGSADNEVVLNQIEEVTLELVIEQLELVVYPQSLEVIEVAIQGPAGVAGQDGEPGPQGPPGTPGSGGDQNLYFTQGVPSTLWSIMHAMGKYPAVTVLDTSHRKVYATVTYPSLTEVQVSFSQPTMGTATLN